LPDRVLKPVYFQRHLSCAITSLLAYNTGIRSNAAVAQQILSILAHVFIYNQNSDSPFAIVFRAGECWHPMLLLKLCKTCRVLVPRISAKRPQNKDLHSLFVISREGAGRA
jgi:hypothetical protein